MQSSVDDCQRGSNTAVWKHTNVPERTSRMNEWVAFGIVAIICGLLAILVRFAGQGDDRP